MCFYQLNKPSCTCTYHQPICPCKEAILYRSPEASLLSLSPDTDTDGAAAATLSQKQKSRDRGILVKPCAKSWITHERVCLRCCRQSEVSMDTGSASSHMEVDDDDDDDGDGDGDGISPTTPQQLQKQKKKRNMPISVTLNPETTIGSADTPRITKPRRFFKREPLSSPVMRLREKWREGVRVGAALVAEDGSRVGPENGFEEGLGTAFVWNYI